MKRDLKINYGILEEMTSEIWRYKSALDTMECSASNMVKMLRQNTSMAISELEEMYTNFTVELKKIREELQDLYTILSNYTNDMQSIIRPVNKMGFTRVDRNDIYWNMQSIQSACAGVWMLKTQQGYTGLSNISSAVKSSTEKLREEENYRNLVEKIWGELIPRYARQLDVLSEDLNKVYKTKIIPYEDKDDEYNTRVGRLEDKYTDFWEGIGKKFRQVFEALGGLLKGFAVAIYDLVKGIVELLAGAVCYIGAAVVLEVYPPYSPRPECLKGITEWADKTFNGTNDIIVTILKDPMLVVENLVQGISDAYEEEGLAYCIGYGIGSVVGVKGIDKLAKIAKVGMAGEAAAGAASRLDELGITAAECSKLGLTADTFAEFVAKYGDDAVKALKNRISPDTIKKLEQLGIKPGEYEKMGIVSKEAGEAIVEAIDNAETALSHSAIHKMTPFMDELGGILQKEGIDLPTYTRMRLTPAEMLSPEEINMLVRIRKSVPMPTSDTILSKAITQSMRDNILKNGQYSDTIGGYFSTAADTKKLYSFEDYYKILRLDYDSTEFIPEIQDYMTVIRFSTSDVSAIKVPYGGVSNADMAAVEFSTGIPRTDLVQNAWPYSGYGVTATEASTTVPEYVTKTGQYMSIDNGSAMYDIFKDGTEKIKAIFINGEWITVN